MPVPAAKLYITFLIALLLVSLVMPASAGCNCGGGENWDPTSFLNQAYGIQNEAAVPVAPVDRSGDYPRSQSLKSPSNVSAGTLLIDVSDVAGQDESYALHLPAGLFLQDNRTLKSTSEISQILGEAGVSREDSVVVGGQPFGHAAFLVWLLDYLGQAQAALLDSDATTGAGGSRLQQAVTYTSLPRADLLASYDYVISGQAQLVDARDFQQYALEGILGSFNIRPEDVASGDRVMDAAELQDQFSRLDRDRPVLVYADHYYRSSPVWYSLQLMGYDARLYTWEDWVAHQSDAPGVEGNASSSDRFTQLSRGRRS